MQDYVVLLFDDTYVLIYYLHRLVVVSVFVAVTIMGNVRTHVMYRVY